MADSLQIIDDLTFFTVDESTTNMNFSFLSDILKFHSKCYRQLDVNIARKIFNLDSGEVKKAFGSWDLEV